MSDPHFHPPPPCPSCGSSERSEVRIEGGPHYAKIVCSNCGRHFKFVPAPWTLRRARAFTMPYGKFKGKRAGDLPADYARFAADTFDGGPGIACKIVCGLRQPDPSDGR
jgi:hypothetical protein